MGSRGKKAASPSTTGGSSLSHSVAATGENNNNNNNNMNNNNNNHNNTSGSDNLDASGNNNNNNSSSSNNNNSSSSSGVDGNHEEGMVHILKGINFAAQPGEMTVILGPSGSGKTTLLNALAGRLAMTSSNVVTSGEILYGGLDLKGDKVGAVSNYVMQRDKLPPFLTVEEVLKIASALRLKSLSPQERLRRVNSVITDLGLDKCRKTVVGGGRKKGLSGGEMKRLSVAMELLEEPQLLFLDEPTSGLDSALAFDVLRLLTRVAQKRRRTIICTAHQPRSQAFSMFDRILLLNRGEVVYHGTPSAITKHFASLGYPCPPLFNPADFALDILIAESLPLDEDEGNEEKGGEKSAGKKKKNNNNNNNNNNKSKKKKGGGEFTDGGDDDDDVDHDDDDEYGDNEDDDDDDGETKKRMTVVEVEGGEDAEQNEGEKNVEQRGEGGGIGDDDDDDDGGGDGGGGDGSRSRSGTAEPKKNNNNNHFGKTRFCLTKEQIQQLPVQFRNSSMSKNVQRQIFEVQSRRGKSLDSIKMSINTHIQAKQGKWYDWIRQVAFLTYSGMLDRGRNPAVLIAGLVVNIITGLIFGGIFFQLSEHETIHSARSISGALFFFTMNFTFNAFGSLLIVANERELVNRDLAAKTYSASAYAVARWLADLPFSQLPPFVFSCIAYWLTGLGPTAAQFFTFVLVSQVLVATACSVFCIISSAAPNIEVAQAVAPVLVVILMLLGGFYISESNIPAWISWLKYLSFIRYSYSAFVANQFPEDGQWGGAPNSEVISIVGGIANPEVWTNLGILFSLGVGFRVVAYLFLRFTNRRIGLEG